ncbi:hypothetical protein F2Q68_00010332 [Brassica cretica]|uniref:Uncharacterized protein n=1 Tax=Brassica cretica TaxID=69181 RepID=A0A8S9KRT3_BRACR|nr:hypothetical protein F2Q68_00010332 [Brassica cretica]
MAGFTKCKRNQPGSLLFPSNPKILLVILGVLAAVLSGVSGSQEVFFAHHLSKTRGRLEPLCGAMGRYLCVEAGLRSAGHEVAELLVQDIQAEDLTIVWSNGKVLVCRSRFKKRMPRAWISPILGLKLAVEIQMSNLKSQSSRPVSSISLQGNDKMKPIANILWEVHSLLQRGYYIELEQLPSVGTIPSGWEAMDQLIYGVRTDNFSWEALNQPIATQDHCKLIMDGAVNIKSEEDGGVPTRVIMELSMRSPSSLDLPYTRSQA